MWTGDNGFGFRAIEMRTPVGYNAVTAVRTVTFAAIADDRVIRNAHFWFINYRERWIGRLQSPDAVWKTFGASGYLREFGARKRVLHGSKHLKRKPDQANAKATQTAAGHIASAMRSTNENNAFDSRIRAISQSSRNQTVT